MSDDFSQRLVAAARLAATGAYAPYSGIRFGCAIAFEDEPIDIYSGANVENAAYGSTICAERVAICAAVARRKAAGMSCRLSHLAVSRVDAHGDPIQASMPCGACLQVISEFGSQTTTILLDGFYRIGETERLTLNDLMPQPFYYPGDAP